MIIRPIYSIESHQFEAAEATGRRMIIRPTYSIESHQLEASEANLAKLMESATIDPSPSQKYTCRHATRFKTKCHHVKNTLRQNPI